jgi:Tol biopolymer transport system component
MALIAVFATIGRQPLTRLLGSLQPWGYSGGVLVPTERGIERFDFSQRQLAPVLTVGPGEIVTSVELSADGKTIAYGLFHRRQGDLASSAEIYLAGADGSSPRPLAERERAGDVYEAPIFSPDGQQVYYGAVGQSGGQVFQRIERIPLAGGPKERLVDNAYSPALTPDGSSLLFLRDDRQGSSLWTLPLAGGEPRAVLRPGQYPGLAVPRVSPDGSRFLVAIVNTVGASGQPRSLLACFEPPVAEAHGLPWDIWTFDLQGGNAKRLTQVSADDPSAAWSPDGQYIAFWAGNGLFVVGADGTGLHQISERGGYGAIDWAR